jgi:signal transduction histidine kinase
VLDHLAPERWRRTLAGTVHRRWARSRAAMFAVTYSLWTVFCVALWRIGYPTWRVAAVTGILVTTLGWHLNQARRARNCLPEGDGRLPFVLILIATAITGGLQSPLLLGLPGQFSGVLIRRGWMRETRIALGAALALAVASAFAPAAWSGPKIPDPTWTLTVAVVLVLSVAIHTDYVVMVMTTAAGAVRQMLHARDQVASEALARAAELERMSSHMSHELKNPLGAIKALVQLSVRTERDPETRVRLEVVAGEVDRIQSILQGYLSFSRPLESLAPERVALGPLADEVAAILEARAEGARVELTRAGDAEITADPRRLKEALLNVVANAIEATPPGGRVEVRIAQDGERTRISVRDNGRGMAPDVVARLGTPFFTTREAGTGLGVLLARSVFTQHGGSLLYESEPGRGTLATATLPTRFAERSADGASPAGR